MKSKDSYVPQCGILNGGKMNENQIYSDDYERTLDLRDLFFYLAKRWRSLIAMLVIGIVTGCIIGVYVKQPIAYKLTDVDRAELDQLFQYQLLYEDQLKYNEEALVMQLDGKAEYSQGNIIYYLYAGENTALLGSVLDVTKQEGFLDGLREIVKYDVEDRYLESIVEYSFELSTDNSINVNNSSNADKTYGTIHIYINYLDENACREVIEYLETQINALNEQCQKKYAKYTFEQTQKNITDAGNAGILEAQKSALDSTTELIESMKDLEGSFSEGKLEYYNRVYLKEHTSDDTKDPLSKRWIIIIAILFIILWGGYCVCSYIFSGIIRTEDSLKSEYGLKIIARYRWEKGNKNKIDSVIENMEKKGMADTCDIEYITLALDRLPADNILICTGLTRDDGVIHQVVEKTHKSIKVGTLLHTDVDTLKEANESEGVVFALEMKKTKRVQLEAELSACKLYGIKVLGIINMWR